MEICENSANPLCGNIQAHPSLCAIAGFLHPM
jgi:hypothetical protein